MKVNRMGVLYLLAHLVITLGILGVYVYSLAIGHPDETSKVLLYTIVGYWFGAVGMDKIRPSQVAPIAPIAPVAPVAPVLPIAPVAPVLPIAPVNQAYNEQNREVNNE
jgi:hypothetical protein